MNLKTDQLATQPQPWREKETEGKKMNRASDTCVTITKIYVCYHVRKREKKVGLKNIQRNNSQGLSKFGEENRYADSRS